MKKGIGDLFERVKPSLNDTQHNYHDLIDKLADGVAILQDGIIKFANTKLLQMAGYTENEFIGSNFVQHLAPYHVNSEKARHSRAMRGNALPEIREVELVMKNGKPLAVELNGSMIEWGGSITETIVFRAISHRVRELKEIELDSEGYRTVFENSAVAITVTDADENIISWNKFAEGLLGMGRSDLYKRPIKSLYPEEEWQKIRSENVKQKGMQHHLETKIINADHELVDVNISITVLRGIEGTITGSIGVMTDIRERKLAEEAVSRRERYFRAIIEHASEGILVLNRDMSVRTNSGSARRIIGEAKGDMSAATLLNSIHPDDEEHAVQMLMEVMNDPSKPMCVEMRAGREDGTWTWTEIVAINLLDNMDVQGIVWNVRDINERKLAEEAAREREQEYSALVELSPDGIVLLKNDQVVFANSKTHEMLSYSELEGKDFISALSVNIEKALGEMPKYEKRAVLKKLPKFGATISDICMHEIPFKSNHAETLWIEMNSNPIEYKGELLQVVFLRDVTGRKQAEKLRKKAVNDMAERFKELNFLYGVSKITAQPHKPLNEMLQETVDLIPAYWHRPELTCARIIVNGYEVTTTYFAETPLKQSASIITWDNEIGVIEVCYLPQETIDIDESCEKTLIDTMTSFVEKSLVDTLATHLGVIIERKSMEEQIDKGKEICHGLTFNTNNIATIEVVPKKL